MKKWIAGLGALLIVQVVLAIALSTGGDPYAAFTPEEKLFAFKPAQVDSVQIEAADGQVSLKKKEGQWILSSLNDFPADQHKVTGLIGNLSELKKGWPVATTTGALKRFKVHENLFERRITLRQGDKAVARLYLGSSPGLRKAHARAADETDVIVVNLPLFEATVDRDAWIDRTTLALNEKEITRAKLPALTLTRHGDRWEVADLAEDEQTVSSKADEIIKKIAGFTITSLFTEKEDPELAKDDPVLEIILTLTGDRELKYTLSRLKEGDYLLQRNDQTLRFRVPEWEIDPVKDATREDMVAKADQPEEKHAADQAESPPSNEEEQP